MMVGLPLASAVSRSIEPFSSKANEGAPFPDRVAKKPPAPINTAEPARRPRRSGCPALLLSCTDCSRDCSVEFALILGCRYSSRAGSLETCGSADDRENDLRAQRGV